MTSRQHSGAFFGSDSVSDIDEHPILMQTLSCVRSFKRTLFVLAVLISTAMVATIVAPSAYADMQDYTKGFKFGWSEGWKKIKGKYSVPPVPPIPSVPGAGQDTYQDGYNDGFLAGMAEARKLVPNIPPV